MAIVLTDDKHYKDIADVIRNEAVAHGAKFKPESMAAEIKGACDYKYYEGHLVGDAEGFERGKQTEYDAFWDNFQQEGKRELYNSAFAYSGWTQENLNPKYVIQPTNAGSIFYHLGDEQSEIRLDLRLIKDKLDFSKATYINSAFQNAKIRYIGIVDLSSINGTITSLFGNTYWLIEIEKIIVQDAVTFNANCFNNCAATKIVFEGVLATTLNLSSPPLDKKSIESVIGVLSVNASGQTLTLKKTAVQKAFETAEGANDGNTSEEWLNLVASKSNWTITLA